MKKLILISIAALIIIVVASISVAVDGATGPAPSVNEHADFMQVLIGGLVALALFLILWILTGIKTNQGKQFTMIEEICDKVSTLQGEHNVMKSLCMAFAQQKKTERQD